jgi:hypothetical protein
MNEIIIKNEEDFTAEIEDIKIELEKNIKNIELQKDLYEKEEKDNFKKFYYEDSKSKNIIKFKKGQINFKITLFIPILQFLDIKSFLELSRVNHLFHSFIFSFYFYRSVNQVLNFSKNLNKYPKNREEKIVLKKNNNKKNNPQSQSQEEENILFGQTKKIYSSFMNVLTGAFSYINPTGEISQIKGIKNELSEIEKKIELHEKLIDGRIQQLKIYKEINNIKEEIEIYIKERNKIKNKKINNKGKDYLNKQNEKEEYEREYNNLIKEINEIEKEYEEIKKDNERQNKIGINLDGKINKIKYYSNNIFQNNENF